MSKWSSWIARTGLAVLLLGGTQAAPAQDEKPTAQQTAAIRACAEKNQDDLTEAERTMAHFHGPAAAGKNGPVVIWLSKQGTPPASPIKGEATLTPEQAAQFTAGEWYINLHTQSHPAGEIRGQVVPPKS